MALLFVSEERDIFLIDIPSSIAFAQGTPSSPFARQLISEKAPLSEPWVHTEPRTDKAKDNVKRQLGTNEEAWVDIQKVIKQALHVIRSNHKEQWCLERHIASCSMQIAPSQSLCNMIQAFEKPTPKDRCSFMILNENIQRPWHTPSYTSSSKPITLSLQHNASVSNYFIPPFSSFTLSTLPSRTPLPLPASGFHFVLIDPPWPNRSARRRAAYATLETPREARALLNNLHVERYLADGISTTVAMWITNRASLRQLSRAYLEEELRMTIVEEWIWVKVTTNGEPVLPLDGQWRLPYEVLLIARSLTETEALPSEPRRRVVAAVPDEHSRKPCLKQIFEMVLGLPENYVGLEIFARHLVAGWHSWGNQVLLFNCDSYWTASGQLKSDTKTS